MVHRPKVINEYISFKFSFQTFKKDTMTPSPVASLLEKYPHLRVLAARRLEDVTKHGDTNEVQENGERISLLGPGVGEKDPTPSQPQPSAPPRGRVVAEELFAASVAADDDRWLHFQVNPDIPAGEQLDSLKVWLVSNKPSTVTRSSGVGWIAVKFKDKGKKVLEAKAAWDSFEGEKTMEVVNKLAIEFHVMGGKWMCHLPSALIDEVWGKLAMALMCGGLGPSVYMVKVSPVEDIDPNLSRGEHVICVYNTDYQDTEQVMRVENLVRSAGVATVLNYKPDIFSALGIYRNNKWGFRPTIYSSKVMMMEGRSRIETVGTGKWYYNTSKGLQYPPSQGDRNTRQVDQENKIRKKELRITDKNANNQDGKKETSGWSHRLTAKTVDKKPQEVKPGDEKVEEKGLNEEVFVSRKQGDKNKNNYHISNLDKMKTKKSVGENAKTGWSHRLAPKQSEDATTQSECEKTEKRNIMSDDKKESRVEKQPSVKGWGHRLATKQCSDSQKVTATNSTATNVESKISVEEREDINSNDREDIQVKKPLWLIKLEQMKLKNLENMKSE